MKDSRLDEDKISICGGHGESASRKRGFDRQDSMELTLFKQTRAPDESILSRKMLDKM